MRICLVSQEYPPETGGGGIGTQTYLKAQGLSRRGHDIHVVSISWDGTEKVYRDGEITIHRIADPPPILPGHEPATHWLAYSIAVSAKLHALDKDLHFEIIQFPEYGGEGFIYQTDTYPYRSAKYVVQLHGPLAMFRDHMAWPDHGSSLELIGCFMERMVIHRADKVLASSHNTARFCASTYNYPLENIEVIHSAVDTSHFKPPEQTPGPCGPRILFVGNLAGSKGFNTLIEAVLRLRSSYPSVRLRVIGRGDEKVVEEVHQQIVSESALDNFELCGYVAYNDLPRHYAWCDMFAGPSVYEPGPGNVYLEAMACGKPVIACNTGGTSEVVLADETGLLISPGDVHALCNAIVRLTCDPVLRQRLGSKARTSAESRFSIGSYIDRVERIYEGLLKPAREAVTEGG